MGDMKAELLACVDNPGPGRNYTIAFETSEFTALYAQNDQPVFAAIEIAYVPGERCVEQMSLKQYLQSFRDDAVHYEAVVNRIADDLVSVCDPVELSVVGRFTVRGGITTDVTVRHAREGAA